MRNKSGKPLAVRRLGKNMKRLTMLAVIAAICVAALS